MIVYRELSSLANDLGFSPKALYAVSNRISVHYREVQIPKSNGELRRLFVPDPLLKAIQRRIASVLLAREEISPYATAYRIGASPRKNAAPHVGKPLLLKLDVKDFFDHLIYPLVKEKAFPKERYSEENRILLSILCVHRDALPQGAPTSPAISNLILRDFDDRVGAFCRELCIAYTRYCDDMTFSGDQDLRPVIAFVREELSKLGLFLNGSKTRLVNRGQRQSVTGVTVNERLGACSAYKKEIRKQMYYCTKFGIRGHLEHCQTSLSEEAFTASLLGRINYVLSLEENSEMREYRSHLLALRKKP